MSSLSLRQRRRIEDAILVAVIVGGFALMASPPLIKAILTADTPGSISDIGTSVTRSDDASQGGLGGN